jgi:hypothetical protein
MLNRKLVLALAFALIPLLLLSGPVTAQTLPSPISACGAACIRKSAAFADCPLSAGAAYPDESCACEEGFVFEDSLTVCLTEDDCSDGSDLTEYQMVDFLEA